jgi:hypothetical protein
MTSYFLSSMSLACNQLLAKIKLDLANDRKFQLEKSQSLVLAFYVWISKPSVWEGYGFGWLFQSRPSSSKLSTRINQPGESSNLEPVSDNLDQKVSPRISISNVNANLRIAIPSDDPVIQQKRLASPIQTGLASPDALNQNTQNNARSRKSSSMWQFYENPDPYKKELLEMSSTVPNRVAIKLTLYSLIALIPTLAISNSVFACGDECFEKSSSFAKWYMSIYCIPFMMGLILMIYVLKSDRDSLGIKNELFIFVSFLSVYMTLWFLVELIQVPALTNVREKFGGVSILLCGTFVLSCLLHGSVAIQCLMEVARKKQFARNEGGGNKFAIEREIFAVLTDSAKFKRLKLSMAEDLCTENALFLEQLMHAYHVCNQSFSIMNNDISPENTKFLTIKRDRLKVGDSKNSSSRSSFAVPKEVQTLEETRIVQALYRTFIASGSPNELNLPNSMSSQIKGLVVPTLQDKSTLLSLSIFDDVKNEVVKMVYLNNWKKFQFKETARK